MSSIKGIIMIVMLCLLISLANKALNLTAPAGAGITTSFTEDTLPGLLRDLKGVKKTLIGIFTPMSGQIIIDEDQKHLPLEHLAAEKDGMPIQYRRHKRHLYYSYDGEHWTQYY